MLYAMLMSPLSGQTFTTLHSFDSTDGSTVLAGLVQANSGSLYGTTESGGLNGYGTVYKFTPSGALAPVHNFDYTDGAGPYAALVQATDGSLYGTSFYGQSLAGTVFKVTPGGALTTLHTFQTTDGANPTGTLVQATNGNFYGTTSSGGANSGGTIFRITSSGTLRTLYSFCSQSGCSDGQDPLAGLVQATDGNFYGTTSAAGANGYGTVFKITPGGSLTTLYSFCSESGCTDGREPFAGLVQATDGTLYGTTFRGGAYDGGTVFRISPTGTLTTLYSFCSQSGCADGSNPEDALIQATDGNLYGTTTDGGANGGANAGTVFRITLSGALKTLYSFCPQSGCADGQNPVAPLVQDTNGQFYGTTDIGGANDFGTVFSLSVGLGPFVETLPTAGKVGTAIKILGTNLTGATSVTFNGTAAVFKVVSGSLITTIVPAGASTGTVQVVTPSHTLSSNVPFRVIP